jgi:hypothetical protein
MKRGRGACFYDYYHWYVRFSFFLLLGCAIEISGSFLIRTASFEILYSQCISFVSCLLEPGALIMNYILDIYGNRMDI